MSSILVVDDEPHLVRTLAINLRARDYTVETAGDGRTALQSFHDAPPDLVVLDLGLPDLDGVEVLRRVRQVSDVPVIVLSARTDSVDKVEALDLGADDYVTKPFAMDELLARVRVALRRRAEDGGSSVAAVRTPHFTLDFAERRAVGGRRRGAADPHRVEPPGGAGPAPGTPRVADVSCSARCGAPATAASRTTYACMPTSSGASSNRTLPSRGTS